MSMVAPGQVGVAGGQIVALVVARLQPLLGKRWFPVLVNLGALLLLVWGLANWTWMVVRPPLPQVIPSLAATSAEDAGAFNPQPLLSAQLFGEAPPVPGRVSLENIPISSLNLVLAGVVAAAGTSYALISVDGRAQEPFAVGQEIVSGATLQSVYPDRVIILRGGVSESLLLEGAAKPLDTGAVSESVSAGTAPGIREQGQNTYLVTRSAVQEQLRNPQDFLSQALMVPNPGGGFLVREIQPGSVYEKLGLQVGDVLRNVNGYPVNSVNDAMKLYQQLGSQAEVRLEITRGGRPELLQYTLQ